MRYIDELHLEAPFYGARKLTRELQLPTFETHGMTLLKRFTLVIDDGTITHVFYPVFPPDRSARDVIDWLEAERASAR